VRYCLIFLFVLALPSAQAAETAPARLDLTPEFIRDCMTHGMKPEVVAAYLISIKARPIPDIRPVSERASKIEGYLIPYDDHPVSVMLRPDSCAVAVEGEHGESSLAAFERFVLSGSEVFDVSKENAVPDTAEEKVIASYIHADKSKKFRVRYTLSIGKREGMPPLTVISRQIGDY